jgi:Protein of unknown function (DUF3352)
MTGDQEGVMTDQEPTQAYETPAPAVEPAPTTPIVAPPAAARPGRSRLRWLVALVVTVLVAGTAAGATLLLTASAGDAAVLAYVPADSVSYVEVRLDLPGGQRAEVAKLLSAFPGFADQAALNAKLGEAFDRLVKAATNGKHDYQAEIAPWFGGQLAAASGPVPAISSTDPKAALAGTRALVLASVTDAGKATAWVSGILTEAGATTSDETYNGSTITSVHDKAMDSAAVKAPAIGYAVLGKVLVAGDVTSIKAAIDTKGTTGLGSTDAFRQGQAAIAGDRVGFFWTDLKATLASSLASLKAADKDGTASAAVDALSGMIPAWSAGAVRAVSGNLVVDGVSPHQAFRSTAAAGTGVAGLAPKGTIALIGAGDVGATLTMLHDKLAAAPKLAATLKQVDTALGLLGGFGATVGWIGDTGIAVTQQGSSVSGGVIVVPSDAAAAKHLFTQLRSLLEIGIAASGPAISDETYGDATITTVDLSSLAPLLDAAASGAGAGALGGAGGAPGAVTMPTTIKLVYAVTDKVVVLGADPAFVKAVLDARTGDSLAKDPRFAALAKQAGTPTAGVSWLDIAAIRTLAEGMLPAADRTKYETDMKPYLAPIDAFVSVGTPGSDLDRSTMILSVNH